MGSPILCNCEAWPTKREPSTLRAGDVLILSLNSTSEGCGHAQEFLKCT